MAGFDIKNAPPQKGRIAIVTGANIGVGYETSLALAGKGMKVVMACRNLEKAEKAKESIAQKAHNADLDIIQLDLNSLQSVREFAEAYSAIHNRLDLLINNAGIMVPPFAQTEEGFESQMGVNYFAHFALTQLLLPVLSGTEGSRVVSLSSLAHKRATIDFDNLNSEKSYSKMGAYGQSKLACLLFAYELQRRLAAAGSQTISVAAHPGVSETNLGQHLSAVGKLLWAAFSPFMMHKPKQATMPSLYAALAEEVKGGGYVGPTGFKEMKGTPGKVQSNSISHDKAVAQKLWEVSEKLTKTKFQLR
ncbi:oxidoreductase [Flammeovirgaceae bacterium SG7u.111]|nr:oxidoreductase [Flammeovirgaceae bacterium SG7u.132]WPO36594.1 oxidoreductase [Flammeovirgaceae bacterium SG7u.111]